MNNMLVVPSTSCLNKHKTGAPPPKKRPQFLFRPTGNGCTNPKKNNNPTSIPQKTPAAGFASKERCPAARRCWRCCCGPSAAWGSPLGPTASGRISPTRRGGLVRARPSALFFFCTFSEVCGLAWRKPVFVLVRLFCFCWDARVG